jgi:hypothetical protein
MNFCLIYRDYPLVIIEKAIENCHLQLGYLLQMVIFHSFLYVYQRVIPTSPNLAILPHNLPKDHVFSIQVLRLSRCHVRHVRCGRGGRCGRWSFPPGRKG